MESDAASSHGPTLGRWWGQNPQSSPSTDVMNQLCRVCGEPAAGFHFGAFTCEGCKSFFGRTYNNLGSVTECKNNGECVINKKNRTACKACRLRKCLLVGMSKSGSRYGRRSNWFKIHCLLQEQQQAVGSGSNLKEKSALALWGENYKNLAMPPPHFEDSKGSPTEESVALNNNTSSKDRERSPSRLPPTYPTDAAAALWAARNTFLPMQLPSHHISSLSMPFLASPFANFHTSGHPHAPPRFLLPFMQNMHPSTPNATLTVSTSPSRSTPGSTPSPSPTRINRHSSPVLESNSMSSDRLEGPEIPPTLEAVIERNHSEKTHSLERQERVLQKTKQNEESSLAILRSLGPVQDQPIDLSTKQCDVKNRRKSKFIKRINDPELSDSLSDGDEISVDGDDDNESDASLDKNDENFNKRKKPLDLTKTSNIDP